ncbi:MAG: discoidin domain-containing protein [Akkermansiaceae bacterium]
MAFLFLILCVISITTVNTWAADSTYQYYRFTTTQSAGETLIQLSEFDLINDGNKVDYADLTVTNPGGNSPQNEDPPKIIDGDTNTKWLSFNFAPLVFTFNAPVTIDSYNFATANDALGRTPVSWTFEGSDNGATWIEIDSRRSVPPPGDFYTFFDNAFELPNLSAPTITQFSSGNIILPATEGFDLTWSSLNGTSADLAPSPGAVAASGNTVVNPPADTDTSYTLTVNNSAASAAEGLTLRAVTQSASTYRYFRFTMLKLRNGVVTNPIQLSEFRFSNGGTSVVPSAVANPGGDSPAGEGAANIIDGNDFTKWLDFNRQPLVFDFGSPTAIDAYSLTTGGDAPERDPVRWIIEGSDDGSSWTLVDNISSFDFPVTEVRNASFQAISFPVPANAEVLPTGNFPIVGSFRFDPSIQLNGDDSDLIWDVLLTDAVSITPSGGNNLPPTGKQSISPASNTDAPYFLTSNGSADTTTATVRSVAQGAAEFRYFRFTPTKVRSYETAVGVQLSEFTFANAGGTITPISVDNPDGDNPAGQGASNLIDGETTTKWNDLNEGRLIFDLGSSTEITSYALITADNSPGLDPVRWILEGSNNQSNWTLIDNVTAFDFGTNSARESAVQSIAIPVPAQVDPVLFYDFESGLQGWTNVLTSAIGGSSTEFASGGIPFVGATVPVGGTNSIGPDPFGVGGGNSERDRSNETMLLRSPEFNIVGGGSLTAYLIGGQRLNDDNPTSAVSLPEASNSGLGQFLGLGLRRVSDDSYVLTKERSTNGGVWEEIIITADELAATTTPGEVYTLDLIDYAEGGWGWVGMDSVSIPGIKAPVAPLTGLRILSQSLDRDTNQATLTFASEPSKTYQITTSLDLESFSTVLTTLPGAVGTSQTTVTVTHSAASKLFFRVEEVTNQ